MSERIAVVMMDEAPGWERPRLAGIAERSLTCRKMAWGPCRSRILVNLRDYWAAEQE